MAARLFGTSSSSPTPLLAPDTMLYTEQNRPLPAQGHETLYPDDYFAGPVRVFFQAPPGWTLTMYAADLELKWYPADRMGPGSGLWVAPFGAWFVFVENRTGAAGAYSLTVTPQVTG